MEKLVWKRLLGASQSIDFLYHRIRDGWEVKIQKVVWDIYPIVIIILVIQSRWEI